MASSKTKKEQVAFFTEGLTERPNVILAGYAGLKVSDLQDLRNQLKEKGVEYKVIKNNLFFRAWKDLEKDGLEEIKDLLVGPLGVVLAGDELPAAAKILKDYEKKTKTLEIKGGFFEGKVLNTKGIKAMAGLPTKEEFLGIIGRGINSPATKIALGMNEVMARLARAVQAVGEQSK